MEHSFITYKKALKVKYEQEKTGGNTNFLLHPTPAKIRDLALFVFEETTNENDLKIFLNFMGFAFERTKVQKIKEEIDRFRPLVTFLKGKTELADYNGADLLAVLLDFNPRPYRNFHKKNTAGIEQTQEKKEENTQKEQDYSDNAFQEKEKEEIIVIKHNLTATKEKKKRGLILGISAGILALGSSVFYNVKSTTEKNCMVWNIDRYQAVNCDDTNQLFIYNTSPIPADKKLLNDFRKMEVDSTTVFFDAQKRPLVWYGKNAKGELEYFNHPGLHPETKLTLKKITPYMIKKYIKKVK